MKLENDMNAGLSGPKKNGSSHIGLSNNGIPEISVNCPLNGQNDVIHGNLGSPCVVKHGEAFLKQVEPFTKYPCLLVPELKWRLSLYQPTGFYSIQ